MSWQIFVKNTRVKIFMKIRPEGDELFYAGGQTDRLDMTKY